MNHRTAQILYITSLAAVLGSLIYGIWYHGA